MTIKNVAVIDIGKTNVKLTLVRLNDLNEIDILTQPNDVLPGPPWPHYNVESHWVFLLNGLHNFQKLHGIDAISVTTHGACIALLDNMGNLVAPILDYEHTGPDEFEVEYNNIRPSFSETGSPRLPMGLNVGAQLYWMFSKNRELKAKTASIVTYPQYWGHRLTGVAATDLTSLGCHTDLWDPYSRKTSSLAEKLGVSAKIANTISSHDILGVILPEIAYQTGIDPDTPVYCGIHDSNASLLPHVINQPGSFSVVSSGTWVIVMSIGGKQPDLDPSKDLLINVNAFGDPVPTARFMGGREYELLIGEKTIEPTDKEIEIVLLEQSMLLPAVVKETGPFGGRKSNWLGDEPSIGSNKRAVATGFYLALVTAHCLGLIGHMGPVIIEGPFAKNRCYCMMLASVTGCEVRAMNGETGTSQGAAMLCAEDMSFFVESSSVIFTPGTSLDKLFKSYSKVWKESLTAT